MKSNEIFTQFRKYYTLKHDELSFWIAEFRPLNPKTGVPWQASRGLTKGHDCHVWHTATGSEVRPGKPNEGWHRHPGARGYRMGFSSEALALAAIEEEKRKSGK